MSYSEVTLRMILRALYRQWKVLLGCIIAFSAIGVMAGVIWADDLATSPKGGTVEGLVLPNFESFERSADYYTICSNNLAEVVARAENCLSFMSDGGISEEDRTRLLELERQIDQLKKTTLIPLWDKVKTGVYIPEDHLTDGESLLVARLIAAESKVLVTESSIAYLEEHGIEFDNLLAYNLTEEQKPYRDLIKSAVQYEAMKELVAACEQDLIRVREHPEELIAESNALEEELNLACEQLYPLIVELQNVVIEISRKGNFDLFVFYNESEDGYYINMENPLVKPAKKEEGYDAAAIYDRRIIIHNHGYRSERDAFATLALFCVLVGICAGGFFAVCRENKIGDNRKEKDSNE